MNFLLSVLLLASFAHAQEEDEFTARWGLLRASGILVFFDSIGPMSYVTMSPKDLPPDALLIGEVRGKSCQHGLSIPTGSPLSGSTRSLSAVRGRGGFSRALEDIRKRNPGLRGIYDVKVDDHSTVILGVYRRLCTEIAARGFK
ncbi:MAG: hypothetical protein HY922_07225 [Elusimicrobia bacterium]|nr:hypothetical protein [Elusimicrobiota bacterium]